MLKQNTKVESTQFLPLGMNPLKFALWLFIVSFVMIFASMTSAYIVRRSEGNWLEFELPTLFTINTIILLFSSVSIQYALNALKKDNFIQSRIGLLITFALGLIFLVAQYFAWKQLVDIKVFLVGNPAGSFVYIISGLHGAHIIGGLIFVLIITYRVFQEKIHSKNILWMEMCTTFWHFLDGLWLYLFFFLILNR